MIMISSDFISSFTNFCIIVSFFLTRLLKLGVLLATAVRAVVVAELVILGILSSIFVTRALSTSF